MSIRLSDVPTTAYRDDLTLRRIGATNWNLHVYNAGVYVQTGIGAAGGAIDWRDEVFRAPGIYNLDGTARRIDALRVRAAVAPTSTQTTPRVTLDAEI